MSYDLEIFIIKFHLSEPDKSGPCEMLNMYIEVLVCVCVCVCVFILCTMYYIVQIVFEGMLQLNKCTKLPLLVAICRK